MWSLAGHAHWCTDVVVGAPSFSTSTGAFLCAFGGNGDATLEQVFGQDGQDRITTTVGKRDCPAEQLFLCSAGLGWNDGKLFCSNGFSDIEWRAVV